MRKIEINGRQDLLEDKLILKMALEFETFLLIAFFFIIKQGRRQNVFTVKKRWINLEGFFFPVGVKVDVD